jgi:sirohydrochlorin ferrochelatase
VRALGVRIAATAPEVDVRVSFLDLSTPGIIGVLEEQYTEGHREVVVVPVLLGSAFHARIELPGLVGTVTASRPSLRVEISGVLGIDPLLEQVALDRLAEAGADLSEPGLGIVLAAVGSSNAPANAAVAALAASWQAWHGVAVVPAFATAEPGVPGAIVELHARGVRRLAVASWFLAPGLLSDRVTTLAVDADPEVLVAAPLGTDPRVGQLVLGRYETVTRRAFRTIGPPGRLCPA